MQHGNEPSGSIESWTFLKYLRDNQVLKNSALYKITNLGENLTINCIQCPDSLCGLVVGVPGHRSRGPGIDSRRYQIF
jgi:hypothetical protein